MHFNKGELVFLTRDLWNESAQSIVVPKGTPAQIIDVENFASFGVTIQLIEMPDIVRANFNGYEAVCVVSPADIIHGSFLAGHEEIK